MTRQEAMHIKLGDLPLEVEVSLTYTELGYLDHVQVDDVNHKGDSIHDYLTESVFDQITAIVLTELSDRTHV